MSEGSLTKQRFDGAKSIKIVDPFCISNKNLGHKTCSKELIDELMREKLKLYRYVFKKVQEKGAAEDIVQEVYTRMLKKNNEIDIKEPIAYAYKIARNLTHDYYSNVSFCELYPEDIESHLPGPAENLEGQQRLNAFIVALETMPRLRKEVFIRRRLHGESYEQISRDLNLSKKAIEKHISRALLYLEENKNAPKVTRIQILKKSVKRIMQKVEQNND